jgi:peptidoglycan-associated lipoprotein
MRHTRVTVIGLMAAVVLVAACGKKTPPVARPMPPPVAAGGGTNPAARPPAPPEPVPETAPIPPEPGITNDPLAGDLDAINKNSPFQPVLFPLDSFEVDGSGQQALDNNAAILKKYPTWVITIEGHCDERGTAEYNLALGEKRALAAKTYMVSLGIPADRLRTVSYGKEFPFDPGHSEGAWSKNRRAHFVVTSK